MAAFGDMVRWRRTALGLTQGELAAKIRRRHRPTTASYICRVESGEIDPRLSTVRSLARAFHMKPWQLLVDVTETDDFWDGYLALEPRHKRAIQQTIQWYLTGGGYNGSAS